MNDHLLSRLTEGLDAAPDILEKEGDNQAGLVVMAGVIAPLQMWLPDEEVAPVLEELNILTAGEALRQITTLCEERGGLALGRFKIEWRTNAWISSGLSKLGHCKKYNQRLAETWIGPGKPPQFLLSLNLCYWLLATDEQRLRLMHHELGHVTLINGVPDGSRVHPVEEFPDTVARFGPDRPELIAIARAVMHHPETASRMREWSVDDGGQALLPWGEIRK